MEDIKIKIKELFKEANAGVNYIAYGRKTTNGIPTGELAIIYGVEEKKPLSELSTEEIIPNVITIDSTDIKTDVFIIGKAELMACICGNTLDSYNNGAGNRAMVRPLKGGLSVTSTNMIGKVGTFGFIAKHTDSGAIVGVSNNHVLIQDAFYTDERNLAPPIKNEYAPIDDVYQNGESVIIGTNVIGKVLRYVPITALSPNKVDCSIFSINQSDVDATSVEQTGEAYTNFLPFATQTELDDLLNDDPPLYSSGRTTGPKGGVNDCDLRVWAIGGIFNINYMKQGVPTTVQMQDQITYVKVVGTFGGSSFPIPTFSICQDPVMGGDSGSALIADYGGVRKIIGLVFAGGGQITNGGPYFYGFANRIDDVASQIGIEYWDGILGTTDYVDPNSIEYITTSNGSPNKTLNCNSNTYWQVGLTTLSDPC